MASSFLHHQAHGNLVTFKRMGATVSANVITDFLARNPTHPASDETLPEHIEVVPQGQTQEATEPGHPDANQANDINLPQNAPTTLPGTYSDSQQRRKKRKMPFRPNSGQQAANGSHDDNANRTSSDGDYVTVDRPDNGSGDEGDPDDESQESKKKEMKRAIAMLQKLSSKDSKCTEALENAEKVLNEAIKKSTEETLEKERTDLGPLHFAALRDSQRSAELLLSHGANINAIGGLEMTALHMATFKGHLPFVKFLLQQPGIDINLTDAHNYTALHHALANPWAHCALLLLQHDADVDICTHKDRTALHVACAETGLIQHISMILAKTQKLNAKDNLGRTALWTALGCEQYKYVSLLLEKGADLNIPDRNGRTPMMQACFEATPEILLNLLDWKPDLAARGAEGETTLHLLCQRGLDVVIQRVLESSDVDINARTRKGITPLMLAVMNKSEKTVRLLVAKKADLNARDLDCETALCMAMVRGYTEIAEILITNGSPTDPAGQSLIKWKSQVENEHRTEQELLALRSIDEHRSERPQQAPYPTMSYPSQLDVQSFQQVVQSKMREISDFVERATQPPVIVNVQKAGATYGGASGEPQLFSSPNTASLYNTFGNPAHGFGSFGMEVDMGLGSQYFQS